MGADQARGEGKVAIVKTTKMLLAAVEKLGAVPKRKSKHDVNRISSLLRNVSGAVQALSGKYAFTASKERTC
jgi:hypothetical protein